MKDKTEIRKPVYSYLSSDIEGVDSLEALALDLRWSWDHSADEIWRQLYPALWDLTHNPWVVPNFPGVAVPLETALILWQH